MPRSFLAPARAAAVIALATAAAWGLSACIPGAAPAGETAATTPPTPAASLADPGPAPSADPRLTAPASARVAPTCDNIMDPASGTTVRDVVSPGGAVSLPPMPVLERGPRCSTDGTPGGDFYTWSPASRADWDALVAEFTADDSAWFTEDGPRGTYLTYKLDGRYSQTFLFTGDAVILAPRKAATDAVIGPPLA